MGAQKKDQGEAYGRGRWWGCAETHCWMRHASGGTAAQGKATSEGIGPVGNPCQSRGLPEGLGPVEEHTEEQGHP